MMADEQQKRQEESCLVVVGAACVGKTALIKLWVENYFEKEYFPTIEEQYTKITEIDGVHWRLEILDTAGEEACSEIRAQCVRRGEGFLCVFAVDDPKSFQDAHRFIKEIKQVKETDTVPVVLVGNKVDLRTVSVEQGQTQNTQRQAVAERQKVPNQNTQRQAVAHVEQSETHSDVSQSHSDVSQSHSDVEHQTRQSMSRGQGQSTAQQLDPEPHTKRLAEQGQVQRQGQRPDTPFVSCGQGHLMAQQLNVPYVETGEGVRLHCAFCTLVREVSKHRGENATQDVSAMFRDLFLCNCK